MNLKQRREVEAKRAGIVLHKTDDPNEFWYSGKRGDYTVKRKEIFRSYAQRGHHGRPEYSYDIYLNGTRLGLASTTHGVTDAILFSENE